MWEWIEAIFLPTMFADDFVAMYTKRVGAVQLRQSRVYVEDEDRGWGKNGACCYRSKYDTLCYCDFSDATGFSTEDR